MRAVNVVEKFGPDDSLERSWVMPSDAIEPLRAHVRMTPEGWITDQWPITNEIAVVVQPWVDEPIDSASSTWFIGSERTGEPPSLGR